MTGNYRSFFEQLPYGSGSIGLTAIHTAAGDAPTPMSIVIAYKQ